MTKTKAPTYTEPTPMSRIEVLDLEREQDERRRRFQAERRDVKTKAGRALSEGPKPLSKDEVAEMEREREKHMSEFLAAQDLRHEEEYTRIMGEENARNGRVPVWARS